MNPAVADAWARLPSYLSGHMLVSLTALVLGLALSLPLALLAVRRERLRGWLLGAAGVVQTIPSLALLALFYPLLLGLSALCERVFGAGFPALGFLPSVLALTLYSMLPVLRNTVAGLTGIDPAVREAARGVGMTPRQALTMVELPLAMPVIMAGVRTAAIWVIGGATLSTPIGQTSLGNYIFTGLQTQNWVFVLFGCVVAAALAFAVDQCLASIERGLGSGTRRGVLVGVICLLAVAAATTAPALTGGSRGLIIGAKPFAEQYVLAALIEQRLRGIGRTATVKEGLGSAIIFNALRSGEIDAYVDYSGTLWTSQMKRTDSKPREVMLAELQEALSRDGILLLGALGFENAYALAMRRDRADALGVKGLADLPSRAPQMTIGGDYEFFGRPEWQALRQAYGLTFKAERQMQSEFMYPAVANGEVDVIAAYSSDGRIAQLDLRVLDDPKRAIPPYDAVLLISPKRANETALLDALKPLVGAIDVEAMREANAKAAEAGGSPRAAAEWLAGQLARANRTGERAR